VGLVAATWALAALGARVARTQDQPPADAAPPPAPETAPAGTAQAAPGAPKPAATPGKPPAPPTAGAADAAAAAQDAEAPQGDAVVELGGYLKAGFGFRVRPDAPPAERAEYGFFGDVGLTVSATLFDKWIGQIELAFDPEGLEVVTDAELFDYTGDGTSDGLFLSRETFGGLSIEEATIDFVPWDFIGAKVGVMRIPFTAAQQTDNTALLFPKRARPNEAFQSGADIGGHLHTSLWAERITASLGAYNGTSLGLGIVDAVARGMALALRIDVAPFGAFPFEEGDPSVGPFRLGVGFGGLYRPATVFDERSGQEKTSIEELRMSATLRMAFKGAYVGVEYLRHQRTDALSSRPELADAGFAQASFFFRVHDAVALEPIARLGFVAEDETFDTRNTGYLEAGASVYPLADAKKPDQVRVTALYLGTRRFEIIEEAHGAALSARLLF
jgi:hypothetical protein